MVFSYPIIYKLGPSYDDICFIYCLLGCQFVKLFVHDHSSAAYLVDNNKGSRKYIVLEAGVEFNDMPWSKWL